MSLGFWMYISSASAPDCLILRISAVKSLASFGYCSFATGSIPSFLRSITICSAPPVPNASLACRIATFFAFLSFTAKFVMPAAVMPSEPRRRNMPGTPSVVFFTAVPPVIHGISRDFMTGAIACTWVESTGQITATTFSPSSLFSADTADWLSLVASSSTISNGRPS